MRTHRGKLSARIAATCTVIVFCTSCSEKSKSTGEPIKWAVFVAEDKSFQVEFPGVPKVRATKTPGGREMQTFAVAVGQTEYMADYAITPSLAKQVVPRKRHC